MQFLTEKYIIESINEYIQNKNANYAIMLSGEWGVGKTYFVRNMLSKNIHSHQKTVYVSLFGAKDTDDISGRIYSAVIESRIGEKLLPVLNIGLKIVGEIASKYIKIDSVKDITQESFSPFIDYSTFFFVFDDLERTSMLINDVLGYINYFVEQNNAKVLIIANDDEIGNLQSDQIGLLKYIIASNDTIDWNIESKMNTSISNGNNNTNKTKLSEIEKRMNLISDQRTHYKKIKEKLIGRTFYFRPNLKKIVEVFYDNIIEVDCNDANFKSDSINIITEIMEAEEYYNLRSVQLILSFYAMILKDSSSLMKHRKDIMSGVFKSIIYTTFEYKKGQQLPEWTQKSEFAMVNYTGEMNSQSYGDSFKLVYDYIYYGTYEKERVISVLNDYSIYIDKKYKSQELKNLKYYWEMDDEDIISSINTLYREFEETDGEGFSYLLLINLLFELKDIGLEPVDIKCFMKIMKEHIENNEVNYGVARKFSFRSEDILAQLNASIDELRRLSESKDEGKSGVILTNIVKSGKGWGEEFYRYYYDEGSSLFIDGIFRHMNIDELIEVLKASSVKDISNFRRTLPDFYSKLNIDDYHQDEIKSIEYFYDKLNDSFTGQIRKYNIMLLKQFIERFNKQITLNCVKSD